MSRRAFTLIELLIVVAIIAILAAIAVPNFLEAQTRSKVSRVKADMRSIATGLESYAVDYNKYPGFERNIWLIADLRQLTTPVAYMTSLSFYDPFLPLDWNQYHAGNPVSPNYKPTMTYLNYSPRGVWGPSVLTSNYSELGTRGAEGACIRSRGPDRKSSFIEHYPWYLQLPNKASIFGGEAPDFYAQAPGVHTHFVYNPTNGTVSQGDIGYFVGALPVSGLLPSD